MPDIIDTLAGLDDAALSVKFGLADKLAKAKKDIAELAALTGDVRAKAAERVDKMFKPNIYPDELGWVKEDASRAVCRDAKEEMCDCSPSSLMPGDD